MSFLRVLEKIGHVANIGLHTGASLSSVIDLLPGGSLAETVITGILNVESEFPQSGMGQQKKDLVMAKATALFPGLDQTKVNSAIDQIVALLNGLKEAEPTQGKSQ